MRRKPGEKKPGWLLIKSDDEVALGDDAVEITEAEPTSVATGRDLDEISEAGDRVWDSAEGGVGAVAGSKAASLPRSPRPQLATLAREVPAGEDWIHEIKYDGYRVLGLVRDGAARILTRNGKDWTGRFPALAEALGALPCKRAVVDGEVVVLDEYGVSRFQRLQKVLSRSRPRDGPRLYLFDLLHLDGLDLTGARLEDRKAALRPLVAGADDDRLRFSDHVRGQGPEFLRQACEMGVEGIISKRPGSPYRQRRTRDWLKIKCGGRQEFVVVGYTEPRRSRVGLGALLLGVHDEEGRLVYAGRVGTGFDNLMLVSLERRLSKLETADAPVADPPSGHRARGVHWVRPELVAEVEFTEWTDDGRIRHPSFQGLREDRNPEEVVREGVAERVAESRTPARSRGGAGRIAGVRVTSREKVVWEGQGVTKGELFEYYQALEDAILPQLADRPLTLVRCPSGAGGKCFYQKNANESVPDVIPRVEIEESDGAAQYMYVDGLPSLIALVQLGVLEFHVWGSRRDRLDRPDRLVFDLDPDEGLPFGRVTAAALRLRERLGELGLESYPKATGGKGLHLVVPLVRRVGWDVARPFAEAVARKLVAEDPDHFTTNMSKAKRRGKIFVDYLRNAWNATAIADYSTRARPGAPVAVPLSWDEVSPRARKPPVFTVRDVPERVASGDDPWPGFDDVRQSITAPALRAVS